MILHRIFNKKHYYFNKANKSKISNDHINAVKYFESYFKLKPNDIYILKDIANEFVDNSNHEHALIYFSLYLKYRPKDVYVLKDRAFQYYLTNKNMKALNDLNLSQNIKKQQKIKKKDVFLFEGRARSFMYLNENMKALEDINTAIKLEPNYSWLYETRAEIYNRLTMTEKAEEDLKYATLISNKNKVASENIEISNIIDLLAYKNYEEAINIINIKLLEYPENSKLLYYRAELCLNNSIISGEFDLSYLNNWHLQLSQAVDDLKKVIEIDPAYSNATAKLKEANKRLNKVINLMK